MPHSADGVPTGVPCRNETADLQQSVPAIWDYTLGYLSNAPSVRARWCERPVGFRRRRFGVFPSRGDPQGVVRFDGQILIVLFLVFVFVIQMLGPMMGARCSGVFLARTDARKTGRQTIKRTWNSLCSCPQPSHAPIQDREPMRSYSAQVANAKRVHHTTRSETAT